MRRRDFVKLIGGVGVSWPLPAPAQQRVTPVVGFLGPGLDARQRWLAAFRAALAGEGFVDGQNVRLEYRSADGGAEGMRELDLARRDAAVIARSGHRK